MDLADPQQWHGYAYANNNPTTWSDPTGLIARVDDEGQRGLKGAVARPASKKSSSSAVPPTGPAKSVPVGNTRDAGLFSDIDPDLLQWPAPRGLEGTAQGFTRGDWAGLAVGVLGSVGCALLLPTGPGAFACFGVVGAAASGTANAVDQHDSGQPFDLGSFALDTGIGALTGAATYGSFRFMTGSTSLGLGLRPGPSASNPVDIRPPLSIGARQFGAKWGRHAADYGLNPASSSSRAWYVNRARGVHLNPDEVRRGAWNPSRGGGEDYFFFRQGDDLLVTRPDGTFVTMFPGASANGWFKNAEVFPH